MGEEEGALAAAALTGCTGSKELAGSQGTWPAAQREGLKAEVQRPRSGEGRMEAGSLE